MNIDGRYHDATPPWLVIHKRWLVEPSTGPKTQNRGHKGKTLVLDVEGDCLTFNSHQECADYFEVQLPTITMAVQRMRRRGDSKAKISGNVCYLVSNG